MARRSLLAIAKSGAGHRSLYFQWLQHHDPARAVPLRRCGLPSGYAPKMDGFGPGVPSPFFLRNGAALQARHRSRPRRRAAATAKPTGSPVACCWLILPRAWTSCAPSRPHALHRQAFVSRSTLRPCTGRGSSSPLTRKPCGKIFSRLPWRTAFRWLPCIWAAALFCVHLVGEKEISREGAGCLRR